MFCRHNTPKAEPERFQLSEEWFEAVLLWEGSATYSIGHDRTDSAADALLMANAQNRLNKYSTAKYKACKVTVTIEEVTG